MIKYIIAVLSLGLFFQFGQSSQKQFVETNDTKSDSLGQEVTSYDFGATMYMGSHDSIDELLEDIKTKYAGKAIILDLWGTFCPPCLADFKNSPGKKATLKEMDVHMVYLCAGKSSNPNEWKKVVERDKLIGDHIYLDRALTQAYMDKFEIRRYPNYILIDKEGNFKTGIISAVNNIRIESFKQYL